MLGILASSYMTATYNGRSSAGEVKLTPVNKHKRWLQRGRWWIEREKFANPYEL